MPTLDWIGKRAVVGHHLDVPYRLMRCDTDESCGNPEAGNLLVQGDNLEALKALLPYYGGQIKCVYIDPPYNTGRKETELGGWFYDDRVDSPEIREWLGRVVGPEGLDLSRHDKWLCMMYPRLKLLHEMLREDGVIFVSIDDNEHRHLHCLLDEIFGSKNHLGTIIWNNATDNNKTRIATEHEYIVCFAKDPERLEAVWKATVSPLWTLLLDKGAELISIHKDNPEDLQLAYKAWFKKHKSQLSPFQEYDQIDSKKGIFTGSRSVHNPGKEGYRYDILHPTTGKPCSPPLMGYRFPESTARDIEERKGFIYGEDENKIVELKLYLADWKMKLSSIFELDGRRGANQLSEIFEGRKVFNNPKPVELISELLSFATGPGDIILDSFAGSGSTGHAVLKLNAEVEGDPRRFVLVERSENTAVTVTARRLRGIVEGGAKTGRGGKRTGDREALGGGMRYCVLDATLANSDGTISQDVAYADLAAHVWFSETGSPLSATTDALEAFLGFHRGRAVFLLFRSCLGPESHAAAVDGLLDARTLRRLRTSIPNHDGDVVVYGEACTLTVERLAAGGVTFKQIPYQIAGFQK